MNEILQGKVKTVYDVPDDATKVLIKFHDKVTAGTGRSVDFPEEKGKVCCLISVLLFEKLEKGGIKTHYVGCPSPDTLLCKKLKIVPIEVIVRNICAGSIVRQTTLEEGDNIPNSLVEWYMKDDEKDDPLLTEDRINLMGYGDVLKDLESIAREVNSLLKSIFHDIDLTLVDFKLEFGYDVDGNLLLADELSPDGMRLWKKGTSESFDEDLFRKDEGDIVNTYQYILRKLEEADSCTEI